MSDLAATYLAQAKEHLAAGNVDKAIDLLEHAVAVGPSSKEVAATIFSTLADAYQRTGQLRKAGECRKRAEALRPEPVRRAVVPSPAAGVEPPVRRARSARGKWYILGTAIFGTALIVVIAFFWLAREDSTESPPTSEPDRPLPTIIKKIQPSTVLIIKYGKDGKMSGKGSGFFVSRTGYIITNRHVLKGTSRAEIKTAQGKVYPITHILAEDKKADLVLASVDIGADSVRPLTLSNTIPQVGQRVVVIGNPLGLEGTVSDGLVSAVRDIPTLGKVIQLSAPISPGSSGGPVVDMQGQVIGIATFQFTKGQNLNFATPGRRAAKLTAGKPAALVEWQKASIYENLTSAEKHGQTGLVHLRAENTEEALRSFEKSVESDPQNHVAWLLVGYCQFKLDRPTKAIAAFKQAIRIKPDFAQAHYHIGLTYSMVSDRNSALREYKLLKDLDNGLASKLFGVIHK